MKHSLEKIEATHQADPETTAALMHETLTAAFIELRKNFPELSASVVQDIDLVLQEKSAIWNDEQDISIFDRLLRITDQEIERLNAGPALDAETLQKIQVLLELRDQYRAAFDQVLAARDSKDA